MNIEQIGFGSARHRYEVTGEIDCTPQELADRCFACQTAVKNRVETYYGFQIQNFAGGYIQPNYLGGQMNHSPDQSVTIVVLLLVARSAARYSI